MSRPTDKYITLLLHEGTAEEHMKKAWLMLALRLSINSILTFFAWYIRVGEGVDCFILIIFHF